jgi:hypothetical protein
LTKNPITINGEKKEDIIFYYFDTENFVPFFIESEMTSGQMKGATIVVSMSDYQEVDGLYFPFSMTEGIKGMGGSQPLIIESIELNPTIDATVFALPTGN